MDKLRIGIIGTGGIAHAHARAYQTFEDVEIVAGADIIPGKARAFLDEFGWTEADAYETCEELCARDDIDAVSVCTYNTQHAPCAIAALMSGKHVLLEKPMTVTLEDALAIRKAEKESGKIITIGFQPRYGSNMKKVKEIIASGTLGDVYYIQSGGGRRRGIPGNKTFITKETAGVGALADIGCYGLDFALNSVGYPKPLTVSAVAYDNFGKNPQYYKNAEFFNVDDFTGAFIRLEGGITLDYRMGWAMHMDTTGDFLFLGKEGGLKIKQPSLGTWGGAWDGAVGEITLFHDYKGYHTQTSIPTVDKEKVNLFHQKVRSFVDAVKNGTEAPIPTSQIIYNQAIIDGIIRSAACGHEVEINLPDEL